MTKVFKVLVFFLMIAHQNMMLGGIEGGNLPTLLLTNAEFEDVRIELLKKDLELVSEEDVYKFKKVLEKNDEIDLKDSMRKMNLKIKKASETEGYTDALIELYPESVYIEVYK